MYANKNLANNYFIMGNRLYMKSLNGVIKVFQGRILGSGFRVLRNVNGLGSLPNPFCMGKHHWFDNQYLQIGFLRVAKRNRFFMCSKFRNPLPSRFRSFALRFKDSIGPLERWLLYILSGSIQSTVMNDLIPGFLYLRSKFANTTSI